METSADGPHVVFDNGNHTINASLPVLPYPIEYLNIKRAQVQFLAKLSYTWEIVAYTWAHLVYEGLTLIPPGSA